MTTTPSIGTVDSTVRMASTAAPSAPSLSPRPIQREAAMAAASVTRQSSKAMLRSRTPPGESALSGRWGDAGVGDIVIAGSYSSSSSE